MPGGVRLFLIYALLILAAIGVALPRIIELAVGVPVSFEGLLAMILLAYTIFTTTLVLQRKEAARALAVELHVLEVRQPSELASAFAALTAWRAEALLAISDAVFGGTTRAELAQLAATHRLPAIYMRREFVEVGGLLAYGPSWADNFRRVATYVDKILKGAKPTDLPVEQPRRFEFVINLKTAKAFGITIPPHLLVLADEVIQ